MASQRIERAGSATLGVSFQRTRVTGMSYTTQPLRLQADRIFYPTQVDFFSANAIVQLVNALAKLV